MKTILLCTRFVVNNIGIDSWLLDIKIILTIFTTRNSYFSMKGIIFEQ
jgi:hypothetical protein